MCPACPCKMWITAAVAKVVSSTGPPIDTANRKSSAATASTLPRDQESKERQAMMRGMQLCDH
jgi:hypothetical protein